MEQLYNVMDKIKDGKIRYSKEERDRICREREICEYTRYGYNKAKLEAALKQCVDNHTHNVGVPRKTKPKGSGTGGGKLQLEAERNRLILEIENG